MFSDITSNRLAKRIQLVFFVLISSHYIVVSHVHCHFTSIIGMSNREVMDQVPRGYRMPKPMKCSDHMYDIMLKCWSEKDVARPTFEYLWSFFDDYFVSTEPQYKDSD